MFDSLREHGRMTESTTTNGSAEEKRSAISSFLMDDALHEDGEEVCDEFEEFPVEDWPATTGAGDQDRVDYSYWESEWDLDAVNSFNSLKNPEQQLFCDQLRSEIAKLAKQ